MNPKLGFLFRNHIYYTHSTNFNPIGLPVRATSTFNKMVWRHPSKRICIGEIKKLSAFEDIMDGAVHKTMDPASCVPLSMVRSVDSGGVVRLKQNFRTNGLKARTGSAVIVRLVRSLKEDLYKPFGSLNLGGDEIQAKVDSGEEWFGVADGEHTKKTITELIDQFPQ